MGERKRKDLKAIGLSLLFLATGFFVVWLTKGLLDVEGDAVFVSLLLIPLVVYMVLSGRLQELKGPGGLEFRFADVAQDSVQVQEQSIAPSIDELDLVAKGPLEELEKLRDRIDEARPTVMTIQLVASGPPFYGPHAIATYLEFLSKFRNFKFVVFLDPAGRFVAYMAHWALADILRKPELGVEFINAINRNQEGALLRYPGIIRETISSNATNAEALREMEKHNLEALLVVDDGSPKGVVERERILSRMMLALT